MKLLLDTHIWLWSQTQPERLSRRAARAIEDGANELWLSPISIWELGVLVARGRVDLTMSFDAWVAGVLRQEPLLEAPVTREVAMATRAVTLAHDDPADRLLAATARVLDLSLVTADERLIAGKGFKVLANR